MLDAVEPDSAQPFNFQRAYRLSDDKVRLTLRMKELDRDQFEKLSYNKLHKLSLTCFSVQTQKISDHYPVEVELTENKRQTNKPRGKPTKKKGTLLT